MADIGMHLAAFAADPNIADGMIHKFMFLAHANLAVNPRPIGMQDAFRVDICTEHGLGGHLGGFENALTADIPATLNEAEDFLLVAPMPPQAFLPRLPSAVPI